MSSYLFTFVQKLCMICAFLKKESCYDYNVFEVVPLDVHQMSTGCPFTIGFNGDIFKMSKNILIKS
jgi:hypothetical protein